MKTTSEKCDKVLRDLMIINHDRAEGYAHAVEDAKDNDLKIIFARFSNQSKMFNSQLKDFIGNWDLVPADDETKMSGKLYRIWMDLKASLSGNNRKSVLDSCEYGEQVTLKTYDNILADTTDIPADVVSVIKTQRAILNEEHEIIGSMLTRAA